MRHINLIATGVILLFSLYVFVGSFQLDYMKDKVPGPGFFPFWIGLLMGALSLLMLVRLIAGKTDDNPSPFKKQDLKEMAVVIGGSIGAVLLSKVVGLIIALGLMTGFIAQYLGTRSRRMVVVISVATPVTLYVIFVVVLGVPVPSGLFGL